MAAPKKGIAIKISVKKATPAQLKMAARAKPIPESKESPAMKRAEGETTKGRKMAAKPNPKAKLGSGGRFAAVMKSAKTGGAKNPAAVAASVGRAKYGAKKMGAMAAKGRARSK